MPMPMPMPMFSVIHEGSACTIRQPPRHLRHPPSDSRHRRREGDTSQSIGWECWSRHPSDVGALIAIAFAIAICVHPLTAATVLLGTASHTIPRIVEPIVIPIPSPSGGPVDPGHTRTAPLPHASIPSLLNLYSLPAPAMHTKPSMPMPMPMPLTSAIAAFVERHRHVCIPRALAQPPSSSHSAGRTVAVTRHCRAHHAAGCQRDIRRHDRTHHHRKIHIRANRQGRPPAAMTTSPANPYPRPCSCT